MTAQQPENNAIRVALQALAAVMGGTQSLHTNSMDEALWLPTEKLSPWLYARSRLSPTNLGVADSSDPLGGAYLIEYLTDEIEGRAASIHRKN